MKIIQDENSSRLKIENISLKLKFLKMLNFENKQFPNLYFQKLKLRKLRQFTKTNKKFEMA